MYSYLAENVTFNSGNASVVLISQVATPTSMVSGKQTTGEKMGNGAKLLFGDTWQTHSDRSLGRSSWRLLKIQEVQHETILSTDNQSILWSSCDFNKADKSRFKVGPGASRLCWAFESLSVWATKVCDNTSLLASKCQLFDELQQKIVCSLLYVALKLNHISKFYFDYFCNNSHFLVK